MPTNSKEPMLSRNNQSNQNKSYKAWFIASLAICCGFAIVVYQTSLVNPSIYNKLNDNLTSLKSVLVWTGDKGDWKSYSYDGDEHEDYAVCGAQLKNELLWSNVDCDGDCYGTTNIKLMYCHKDDWKKQDELELDGDDYGEYGKKVYCPQGFYATAM